MGKHLNPSNRGFVLSRNAPIYVDKSLLIQKTNEIIDTKDRFVCVSRPRRFGKSTDAKMLIAYYSKDCDSTSLFNDLKISQTDMYHEHLNKHNVIFIDMQSFYDKYSNVKEMLQFLSKSVLRDLFRVFKNVDYLDNTDLPDSLDDIYVELEEHFIFIIDEWDSVLRNKNATSEDKKEFLKFMNRLLKEKEYVSLAYMTGILPIKKYGDESAINMFDEINMIEPQQYENFMGFTEDEVKDLCLKNNMDFDQMKVWYDGYHITDHTSIYSPRSIIKAISSKECNCYWSKTGTFENLANHISMDFDGLKEAVIQLLAGEKVKVDTAGFQNDMSTFKSKDDVLTMLIHLGYLGYDRQSEQVYIPNKEVIDSFIQSIKTPKYEQTYKAIERAQKLLESTWDMDEEKVASGLEEVHDSFINSNLKYNDENSLYTTIMLAYFTARDYYTPFREMPTGKGFCDVAFIPYNPSYPAIIIELKYDKDVETAIDQIKERNYSQNLKHYHGNLLLVGITYNKGEKKHIAKIEKFVKE
ncbi:MAG: ATP-binding protein [Erysipelotrichaceae bacterium]|nr:ATP-binding protein [Erysipelotrichaceae bacterium]